MPRFYSYSAHAGNVCKRLLASCFADISGMWQSDAGALNPASGKAKLRETWVLNSYFFCTANQTERGFYNDGK